MILIVFVPDIVINNLDVIISCIIFGSLRLGIENAFLNMSVYYKSPILQIVKISYS